MQDDDLFTTLLAQAGEVRQHQVSDASNATYISYLKSYEDCMTTEFHNSLRLRRGCASGEGGLHFADRISKQKVMILNFTKLESCQAGAIVEQSKSVPLNCFVLA